LTEYRICGEAAAALEAALQERDEADRRYHEVCAAWLRAQQTTHGQRPPASNEALATVAARSAADRDHPDGSAFP
jgi:hypothetical protein